MRPGERRTSPKAMAILDSLQARGTARKAARLHLVSRNCVAKVRVRRASVRLPEQVEAAAALLLMESGAGA